MKMPAIKKLRPRKFYETMFTVGLCLAIAVVTERRFELLPDFLDGVLAGLSITLMLVCGAFKNRAKE